MRLSDEALNEFIALYKNEFKTDLTKAEASEAASRLLTLYELLSRPLPKEHNKASRATQRDDQPPA